jgi:hypothetical protein
MTTIKNMVSSVLAVHNVRVVGSAEYEDDFGDAITEVNPHFNDLNNCDLDKVLKHLQESLNMRVCFSDDENAFLIKKK